jgi:Ca2+-binding EF-hand superfamily protein
MVLGSLALPGLGRAQEHRLQDLNSLPSPMEALRDVQNAGRLVFVLADANHDGLISQQEAIDANDLLVGGFFFRADADGNGVVTEGEAKAVVDKYLDQNPWLKYVVESLQNQAKQKNAQSGTQLASFQGIVALIDTNNDKQIQATELRQLVQTLTQSYFAAADTNRDGQMSPSEVNAAVAGIARSIAQQTFQQADTDHNGQLSRAEYDKALVEPANAIFQIIDLNHDGQLSQQEADQIGRVVVRQVRNMQLPEPANSPTNLIEGGKLPREAAPVPTFTAPNTGGNGSQPAPPR